MAVPVSLLRRNIILRKLRECGADSEATAKTLAEANVFNPNAFPKVVEKLVKDKIIIKIGGNRYYLHG